MTAGVYGRRKLYDWASWEKSDEDARRIGTFFLAKQSLRVPAVGVEVGGRVLDVVGEAVGPPVQEPNWA